MNPSFVVYRGIRTPGFLGTLAEESGDGRKGRRMEEGEGAGRKKAEDSRKGKKGKKGGVPSWDPSLQRNPHCGSGSFLLWESYQDLKSI